MARHEGEIQNLIISAVKYFFSSGGYGFNIPDHKIKFAIPSAGGQAKRIDDFGRKPYDVGIFAPDTVVLFFEIKERNSRGRIDEYRSDQCEMLKTLAYNGVDIRYAYNGWDFQRDLDLTWPAVLKEAHVRAAKDMCDPIEILPLPPAVTLEDYLLDAVSSNGQDLANLLDRNISQLDSLNSMPLMILANLDPENSNILIDKKPRAALKMMKDLFGLPKDRRAAELARFSLGKDGVQMHMMAEAIFAMKDAWEVSQKTRLKP